MRFTSRYANTELLLTSWIYYIYGDAHEKEGPVFQSQFFRGSTQNKALGVPVKTVKPILTLPDQVVRPGYNVGSRGNGVDQPKWPEDLLTETVV